MSSNSIEDSLKASLKEILQVKKVTLDEPGDSKEQGCLFINIESAPVHVTDGRIRARVQGSALMIGTNDKLTIGFFAKAIAKAPHALKKPFFFFGFEDNTNRYRNLVQRSFSFVYFFDSQYDPNQGNITNIAYNMTNN